MNNQLSFIEKQFPVSKVSKESFKERKANNGQTLTGLGKWWGRKPLILVRAAIIGCLMPASDNPKKDMEIFLKILSMDDEGLLLRKQKQIKVNELYDIAAKSKRFANKLNEWFIIDNGKIKVNQDINKLKLEELLFSTLGYDEKLKYCIRPEQLSNISEDGWNAINQHLRTDAHDLPELIQQLSDKRYGHNVTIGDCFAGGGSIPFEAARCGANVYGSDLNPIAALLTWASIHINGASKEPLKSIMDVRKEVFDLVNSEIGELGVENSICGDRALNYIYCTESICPECGFKVPLIPSLVIGQKTKTIAILVERNGFYDIEINMGVSDKQLSEAEIGTVVDNALSCPHCKKTTPISAIRHDIRDNDGNTIYGLRQWQKNDISPMDTDVFQERLYSIKYLRPDGTWYHSTPNEHDLKNEMLVNTIINERLSEWQRDGLLPIIAIESGYNTEQIIREKGWRYWHQLFTPRQLLTTALFIQKSLELSTTKEQLIACILGINRMLNWNSRLSRWSSAAAHECGLDTFYNQALNTFFNYSTRAVTALKETWFYTINSYPTNVNDKIVVCDARTCENNCELWITDPPYADAVNYHELTEFFLAWDKKMIQTAFNDWYVDSKRVLAVKGDENFSKTMIEIYSNLTMHMPADGMQVVMFTHSDPAVWAQLAIIMWKAGLKVTAAWNIATETEMIGMKIGNYVKGTVLLVLRKQTGDDMAFLDEINSDIRNEVKSQIESMQKLDDKEEPNFSDPDYVLAAYAASLKVLTAYATIEDLNLDFELNQAIQNPAGSKIVTIIENAKKIAYDCVIPLEFDSFLWRELTNAEKFYIKGLESEKHGNYQIGTYQEFARGFSIGGYSQLMANERANTARLKTPYEMASRTINDIPDFENSLMRIIFSGIYVGIKEDRNPNKALGFIKNELSNYWDKREMIQQILAFLISNKDISNMQLHWAESADMAELLLALVSHDSI